MANQPGYSIEQVEDAILAALESLKEDSSIKLRTLKTYQGELETEQGLTAAARLFPAVFVVYAGSEFANASARRVEAMTFGLFIAAGSLRSEDRARRGGDVGPGSYALLHACRDLLYGSRLTLEIDPLDLVNQKSVWFAKGLSVYGQEWKTKVYHLFDHA